MIVKDGDCENCEHFVKDAYGQWVCEFDGECENMVREQTNEEMLRGCTFEEMAGAIYEWYSQGHIEGKVGKQLSSVTRVVEWLKEKHDGNVL